MKKKTISLEIRSEYVIPILWSFLVIGWWTLLILLLFLRVEDSK